MDLLPTGTATDWRRLDNESTSVQTHTYVFDGQMSALQGPEFLAEQLRQDGAASNLGAALSMSEQAHLSFGWLYYDEDTDTEFVSEQEDHPWLDSPRWTLIARVEDHD